MHVVMLNQPFFPDVVATAQMGKDLADALTARGHRVTAVASRSIYGQTGATLPARQTVADPAGPGVLHIHRVGSNIFGKRGVAARLFDFGLYYALAGWKVLTLRPRPDVVISFTTPPYVALLGVAARWLRGARSVYWVMDLYPDVGVAGGVFRAGSPLTGVLEALGRFVIGRSDAVVALGRCMAERIGAKGCRTDHLRVITVWDATGVPPPPAGARTEGSERLRRAWDASPSDLVVMYSGNMGLAHDAATICQAMGLLSDRADIRFVFVGGGKRRAAVERAIAAAGLTNAAYHEYVPRERLADSLGAADVHLVSIDPAYAGLVVPSKLYSVLAAGRPVVYVGPAGTEIGLTIAEHGCGRAVANGDAAGLARALAELADDRAAADALGRAAAACVPGRYDRASCLGRWVELVEGIGAPRR